MPSRFTRRAVLHRALAAALAIGGAAALAACGRGETPRGTAVPPGATVLALGDSLTAGTGATAETAFPARLAAATGWNLVNAGVPGHTAAQALERLPALLAEHRPALVIVSIGGNDLLRRMDEGALREQLRRILVLVREAGAQGVLVAVPRPTVAARLTGSLADHPLYAEVAKEAGVPLHAEGWSRVLGDAALRSDEIHANAAGHEVFSRGLVKALREAGLLAR
jgi:lysophospholipase L1-like esterase